MVGFEKLEDSLIYFCNGRPDVRIEVIVEADLRELLPQSPDCDRELAFPKVKAVLRDLYEEISSIIDEHSLLVPIGDAFATTVSPLQLREIIRLPNVLAVNYRYPKG